MKSKSLGLLTRFNRLDNLDYGFTTRFLIFAVHDVCNQRLAPKSQIDEFVGNAFSVVSED